MVIKHLKTVKVWLHLLYFLSWVWSFKVSKRKKSCMRIFLLKSFCVLWTISNIMGRHGEIACDIFVVNIASFLCISWIRSSICSHHCGRHLDDLAWFDGNDVCLGYYIKRCIINQPGNGCWDIRRVLCSHHKGLYLYNRRK